MCSLAVCMWLRKREMEKSSSSQGLQHIHLPARLPVIFSGGRPLHPSLKRKKKKKNSSVIIIMIIICAGTLKDWRVTSNIHWGSKWFPLQILCHVNLCPNMREGENQCSMRTSALVHSLCVLNNRGMMGWQMHHHSCVICNSALHISYIYKHVERNVQQDSLKGPNQRKWPLESSSVMVVSQQEQLSGAFYVINSSAAVF